MYHNFIFNDASEALPKLLDELLVNGDEVGSRAGRTKELMHVGITLNKPWRREILVNARKPDIAAQIAETMWVLSGRDDMEFLSRYLPRAKDFSDDGEKWRAGYGARLRAWDPGGAPIDPDVDQLAYIVNTLKDSPASRQAVMSIWDPRIDTEPGKDIPCNNWLSFSSRLGYLDLHVAIRSNDAMWGWSGINAFEWSALQEVVAGILGLRVGGLHFSTTSFHLYDRHWAKAEKIVNSQYEPSPGSLAFDSPRFEPEERDLEYFDILCRSWFQIEERIRKNIDVTASVNSFPEPMLQSWLRIIQWRWTGDEAYLEPLKGSRLEVAARMSIQPKIEAGKILTGQIAVGGMKITGTGLVDFSKAVAEDSKLSPFINFATKLHREKDASYGDSWKRRGEMLGILANIARKVDRLGKSETSDETSADTAMDLMVYLAKYRIWIDEQVQGPYFVNWGGSDNPTAANALLEEIDKGMLNSVSLQNDRDLDSETLEDYLRQQFEHLEGIVNDQSTKVVTVNLMLTKAYVLARRLWEAEQVEL